MTIHSPDIPFSHSLSTINIYSVKLFYSYKYIERDACESESEIFSVVSDSFWPHGLYCPWNSPGQNPRLDILSLLQGIFLTQGSNPGLLHCRQNLLPAELSGKPKNTGVGSLSLLQWVFPPQESNWDFLHCRQILYQLSYQGICIYANPQNLYR